MKQLVDPKIEPVFNEKAGLWLRPGTDDDNALSQKMDKHMPFKFEEDDIVLDLGANIGSFSKYAIEQNVKKVIAFEADEDNFRMLKLNMERFGHIVKCFRRAIVAHDGIDEIDFYLVKSKGKAWHSIIPTKGRDIVKVKASSIMKVLGAYPITVIKSDIEGGEFGIFDTISFPQSVRSIGIEFHLQKASKLRYVQSKQVIKNLENQSFIADVSPIITEKNWTTIGIWYR